MVLGALNRTSGAVALDTLSWFGLIGGLVLLAVGSEWLVRGAVRMARGLGVSALVIGLTVVSWGTSAPELAVSVQSALGGSSELALGNVIGSNIFNVLVILGLSAVIIPLVVTWQVVRIELPLMVGISVGAAVLALDGEVGRWDGALLLGGMGAYTWWQFRGGVSGPVGADGGAGNEAVAEPRRRALVRGGAVFVGGLVVMVLGSRWFVSSAVDLARWLGVGEVVIGLTIVATGTSLPEVFASLAAAMKGERDLAVGNVVGSNVFNLLAVLGLTAAIGPVPVGPEVLWFDVPLMLLVSLACMPIFLTGMMISRVEGVVFCTVYGVYVWLLIERQLRPGFAGDGVLVVFGFLAPLAFGTLLGWMLHGRKSGGGGSSGGRACSSG